MDTRKLAAEAIGTFWLTFAGCGSELGDQPLVGLAEHVGRNSLARQRSELVEVRDDLGQVFVRQSHFVVELQMQRQSMV